jgi:predicted nucleic acid-binding protein
VPADVPEDAVRDPKDRMILACAVGGKADIIVSGDKDLVVLKAYQGISIVTPSDFLGIVNPPTESLLDEPTTE